MHEDNNKIKQIALAVKASAGINRIRILYALKKKNMCVCEISFILGITQPSVSRHLKKLIKTGFISKRQKGLWTDYYLDPKNDYTRNFLKNLNAWISSDKIIASDQKRLKLADRNKLCK